MNMGFELNIGKDNSRTKNSILNLFSGFGGQILMMLLKFATRTVFIETLGKRYLGINGYFADIISMLSLTELGFDTAIHFKLYKPLAEHDVKRVRILMNFYKAAYRGVGLTILFLGLVLIPLLPHLIRDYGSLADIGVNAPLVYILFLLQSVSSYLFFAYRSAVMYANQKRYVLEIADYSIMILTNFTQIMVLIFLRNFIIYTVVVIVFNLLQNLLNAFIAQKYYPEYFIKEEEKLSKAEVKDLFKDCGALFIYKVNNTVLKACDNMVLGAFVGLTIIGLYSNYLMIFTSIRAFLRKFYSAVKASSGNLFATETIERKYNFFGTMNYITIVLYGTAAVGIAVCANEFIDTWIGPDYVIPQPFPILIGAEIMISGLKQNLSQIRTVTGAFRQMWYRPLIGIVVNIVVSVALVQVWGIYGVIVGTITAELTTSFVVDPPVIYKLCFNKYRPASEYYKRNLLYLSMLAAICAANIYLSKVIYPGHKWISVIIHTLIVVITVPSVYISVFWKTEECQYLRRLSIRVIRKMLRLRKVSG